MKKYKVIVSGVAYEVEIEEISENDIQTAKQQPARVEEKKNIATSAPSGGEQIKSPIPGNILDIKVTNGQVVKSGQVLLILESMKMENEILATVDGKVSFNISKGATVEADDILFTIS